MMLIHLKGCYTVLGKIRSNSKKYRLRFSVPLEGKPAVIVDVIPDENSVESFDEFEVSKEMWDVLQTDISDGSKLPSKLQTELSEMKSGILQATRKVLSLIKYCFNQIELHEQLFSIKGIYWSVDKAEWKWVPMIGYATMEPRNFVYLNENTVKAIQEYLEGGHEPFFALRHLHRAKEEGNPCYKWIDATIAAELAIKEFLIRIKPDIETLLLEVPSPPLDKLFGPVLESYKNVPSPKLKELRKGAKFRNKLIHRPQDIRINRRQSNKYVQDVEIAIYHLLTLLYPKDPIMKTFYRPRIRLT
ncbi:MAG: hypothetical protein ACE5I5_19585 [Candidatus Heimdallarchaeota archaeon]